MPQTGQPGEERDEVLEAPASVVVAPEASDADIAARLQRILDATGWYRGAGVEVKDGIVFLDGATMREDHRKWAGDLARNTQDVVAVVNRVAVVEPPAWDFSPALNGLRELAASAMRNVPYLLFSVAVLALAWMFALLVTRGLRGALRYRKMNALLLDVFARAAGILVFIVGLYSVLHVAGMTSIALAVLGGTGLAGIALGIAFRDITENFLASLFLSAQNPFRTGDLIEVAGARGFVQQMTTRATVLMTMDGNHVQVPNATIYKSNIMNLSANPNGRLEFAIGIGINDSIARAQELIMGILRAHPAILDDPEPWVCAEHLRNGVVSIRVWFWYQGGATAGQKLLSALLRLVKRAFFEGGISMPSEGLELGFASGLPVVVSRAGRAATEAPADPESGAIATDAETQPEPEAETIRKQAARSRSPEPGANLLDD
ncbi:MAG: mechanosensitive ion channel [Xanthomonadaceae bacterium]|nr:mechanosensitive ion channel [Xanthomonadaceae bacterium]